MFYLKKSSPDKSGKTPIMGRITIDGKQTVLSTGISCSPDNWNSRTSEIKDERSNNQLKAFRDRIEQTYENILKCQGVISAEILKNTINE